MTGGGPVSAGTEGEYTDMTFTGFQRWDTAQRSYTIERCRFTEGVEFTSSAGRPIRINAEAHDLLDEL